MTVQSWQTACPRCGWANSGANTRCAKCGWPLRQQGGMLKAGEKYAATAAAKPARQVKVLQPGGFWPRLLALVLDSIILVAIWVPVILLWKAQLGSELSKAAAGGQYGALIEALKQELFLLVGLSLVSLFYYVGSWNILGASPGMLILNLRIVDNTGQSPSFGRALMRYFVMNLLYATLIGALVSLVRVVVDKEKRALHDLMAGTYVIHLLDPDRVAAQAEPQSMGVVGAPALAPTPPSAPMPVAAAYPPLPPSSGGGGLGSSAPTIALVAPSIGPEMAPPPPPSAPPSWQPPAPAPYSPPEPAPAAGAPAPAWEPPAYTPPPMPALPQSAPPVLPYSPPPFAPVPGAPPSAGTPPPYVPPDVPAAPPGFGLPPELPLAAPVIGQPTPPPDAGQPSPWIPTPPPPPAPGQPLPWAPVGETPPVAPWAPPSGGQQVLDADTLALPWEVQPAAQAPLPIAPPAPTDFSAMLPPPFELPADPAPADAAPVADTAEPAAKVKPARRRTKKAGG